jgi:hypothetical protein
MLSLMSEEFLIKGQLNFTYKSINNRIDVFHMYDLISKSNLNKNQMNFNKICHLIKKLKLHVCAFYK